MGARGQVLLGRVQAKAALLVAVGAMQRAGTQQGVQLRVGREDIPTSLELQLTLGVKTLEVAQTATATGA